MKYDENEEEPLTTPDTENRTRINAAEGRPREQDYGPGDYWQRLSTLNTGAADSYGNHNDELVVVQERLAAFDTICGHLELTDWQKREGRRIMEDLNLGAGGLGVEMFLGAFCLAAYVVKEDNCADRAYHPRRADANNCDLFLAVADEFDFRPDRIHSVMNRIEHYVN